MMLAIVVYIYK